MWQKKFLYHVFEGQIIPPVFSIYWVNRLLALESHLFSQGSGSEIWIYDPFKLFRIIEDPESFCVYGFYLLIFTVLRTKIEKYKKYLLIYLILTN